MHNRQRAWLWSAAAVSFIVGFILVLSDSGAGWFLSIISGQVGGNYAQWIPAKSVQRMGITSL